MERVWSFWWIPLQQKLVGLKKYDGQNGFIFPNFSGWEFQNIFELPPPDHPHKFQKLRLPLEFEHVHSKVSHHRKGISPFFERWHADSSKTTSRDCRMFPIQRVYRLSIVQSGHPSQRNRLGPCNACRYLKRNVVGPKGGSVLFVWSKQSLNGFWVIQDTRIKRLNGLNHP